MVTTMSRRQLWLLMAGLMTGMLLAALDQTIVGTALPTGTTSGKTGVPIVQFNPDFKAFSNQFAGSNYRMQLSARYSF